MEKSPLQRQGEAGWEPRNVAYFNKIRNYYGWRNQDDRWGRNKVPCVLSTPRWRALFVAMDGPSSVPPLNDFY